MKINKKNKKNLVEIIALSMVLIHNNRPIDTTKAIEASEKLKEVFDGNEKEPLDYIEKRLYKAIEKMESD